jgi:hypothetical protein
MSLYPTATEQAARFRNFRAESKTYTKVFYGPLYSAADLNGLATADNPATIQLNAQAIVFFQVGVGGVGQGIGRPLRFSETNLDGGAGSLPAGFGFAGQSLGVHLMPEIPLLVKQRFLRHSALAHVRHSHRWNAGACQFWPSGEFGLTSQSVSTTVANTEIQFGVNGRTGMRYFPKGGELYFPPNETIEFQLNVFEPIFITTDGQAGNGGIAGVDPGGNQIAPVDGALVFVIMDGFRYEMGTA